MNCNPGTRSTGEDEAIAITFELDGLDPVRRIHRVVCLFIGID